ncbi:MAG: MBL fold metallo-hydrolase [Anaerolineae bacterium]|nr:MBL fold metallo-hydrolase [Anaerolineae bacterium]
MIKLGDFELYLITDGTVQVDAGGPFGLVPRSLYQRYFQPDPNNLIPMALTCMLVKAGGHNILIDTGLGDKLTDRMKENWNLSRPEGLIEGLARHGVSPDQIDIVIDTHLHGDHCAGNTSFGEMGIVPTFPKAHYYVQKREHYDATHTNERTRATYYEVNFQPLVDSGQMTLLEGDTEIIPGIRGVLTPGHTPGHQSIWLESRGEHALFVSDLASYAVHFERLSWMTSYDVEPLVTLESKRRWQQWALDHHALLIFQHDPVIKAGYGERQGDKFLIHPTLNEHD